MKNLDDYNTYGANGPHREALIAILNMPEPKRAAALTALSGLRSQFSEHELQIVLALITVILSSERGENPLELMSLMTALISAFAKPGELRTAIDEMDRVVDDAVAARRKETLSDDELLRMFQGPVQ